VSNIDESLRSRLLTQVARLSIEDLQATEAFLRELGRVNAAIPESTQAKVWLHAPTHRLCEHGTYIVTAGTWRKQHHFRGHDRLCVLEGELLALAQKSGWQLEAWSVFSNHYHFVGHSGPGAVDLRVFLGRLHSTTAASINRADNADGRKVWHNFWETRLTFEKSYMARLNYVHQNAVKHGLVKVAARYPFCSAGWFEQTATRAQVKTISSFKVDKLRILDDFEVVY
jgi:putative transposase